MDTEKHVKSLHKAEDIMNSYFVERQDETHCLTLAIISGTNLLLLGPPGTAKSNLVVAYNSLVQNAKYFEKLLTKFTTPEEVLGPFSLKALENDEYYRKLEGYIGDAHFAFIDETFKSSSALLNTLLQIMNERKITNGNEILKIPLISLIGASNEIPEESDGLAALSDRFHLKCVVRPIQERFNRIKMLQLGDFSSEPVLTIEDIIQIREEVDAVEMTQEACGIYAEIIERLFKDNLNATDRTYKLSVKILKAEAYFNGRTKVTENDFDVLQHVLWTDPDQKKKLYTSILDLVNPTKNKILELWDSANDLFDNISKLTDKNEQMKQGVETANKLKDIKKKLHEYYKVQKDANKDTSEIKSYEDRVDGMLKDVFQIHIGVPSLI